MIIKQLQNLKYRLLTDINLQKTTKKLFIDITGKRRDFFNNVVGRGNSNQ